MARKRKSRKSSKRGKLAIPAGLPSAPAPKKKSRRRKSGSPNPKPKLPARSPKLHVINFFIGKKVGKIRLTRDLLNDKMLVHRL